MEKRGVRYDFVQSEGSGSVERLTRMLCDNAYHTIVVVGNDYALNEALNAIFRTESLPDDFAFGLIPNGIGNDFARFWGVTVDDYRRTIDRIIERRTRLIDVAYCVYTDQDNTTLFRSPTRITCRTRTTSSTVSTSDSEHGSST